MELEPLAHPKTAVGKTRCTRHVDIANFANAEATGTARNINQLTWNMLDENLELQL